MEPHPVPQNVTSFQFRLVGDMTLRQFLYLAVGSVTAYLMFVYVSPIFPLIAWPLIAISSLLGISFAFLPINSRPLDHWLAAFLRAVYSPTKRIWKKNGKTYQEDPLFSSRFITYLSSLEETRPIQTPPPNFAVHPVAPPTTGPQLQTHPPQSAKSTTADLPSPETLKKTVELAKEEQSLKQRIVQAERTLGQIKLQTAANPSHAPVDLQGVNKVLSDLNELVGQASEVKQELELITNPSGNMSAPGKLTPPKVIKVKLPPKPMQQLALTTFPNVINGIVRDTQGNYLEAVVAVIYDKEGLPVRALKTNKLGQFSGSTPLPNGVYTLELEKENLGFDVLQIELTGQILPPLIITAKEAIRS